MSKRLIIIIMGAAALAMPGLAGAQGGRTVAGRGAAQLQRVDQGLRSGALTRPEANRLRSEFRDLDALEQHYSRSNGLSRAERADLDRRFAALSRRVRVQKNDQQDRRRANAGPKR